MINHSTAYSEYFPAACAATAETPGRTIAVINGGQYVLTNEFKMLNHHGRCVADDMKFPPFANYELQRGIRVPDQSTTGCMLHIRTRIVIGSIKRLGVPRAYYLIDLKDFSTIGSSSVNLQFASNFAVATDPDGTHTAYHFAASPCVPKINLHSSQIAFISRNTIIVKESMRFITVRYVENSITPQIIINDPTCEEQSAVADNYAALLLTRLSK